MYVVWKIIKIEAGMKLDEISPKSTSLISISIFGIHFGYMAVFKDYALAVTLYPSETIIQLPILEISLDTIVIPE